MFSELQVLKLILQEKGIDLVLFMACSRDTYHWILSPNYSPTELCDGISTCLVYYQDDFVLQPPPYMVNFNSIAVVLFS